MNNEREAMNDKRKHRARAGQNRRSRPSFNMQYTAFSANPGKTS
jgi:hypothetical protein